MSQSYAKSPAAERKFTTREMVLVGMFAAVLAVISQISLPMPTGVPITIQVFGVALVGAVLGSRLGTTATLVYVLLGAIGLPIFANFSGGISSIVGVTGGYIWAWPIMDEAVVLLGASAEMAPMAATYGKIVFLCLPMFMLAYVFEMFCSVAGKPGFGFLSSLTAGVVNIGLDAVLMGVFGMGIEGAATATCIAEYSSAMLMVVLFARGKVGVLKLVRPRWVQGVLPRSIVNGVSEMVGCAAMSVVATAYNLQLMNLFGPDGVAAYAVIEYASMLIGAAFGGLTEGMAPLMSYQHGAGNNHEKRSLFGNGATLTAAMGIGAFLVAQLLAQPLAFAFTGYDGVLMALTIHAFRMYSIAFLLMGVTYFGSVMFTAVENGKISALISFVHTFVFELGSVILLPVFFGADSIWWSIVVAEVAASILTIGLVARHAKGYGWR